MVPLTSVKTEVCDAGKRRRVRGRQSDGEGERGDGDGRTDVSQARAYTLRDVLVIPPVQPAAPGGHQQGHVRQSHPWHRGQVDVFKLNM